MVDGGGGEMDDGTNGRAEQISLEGRFLIFLMEMCAIFQHLLIYTQGGMITVILINAEFQLPNECAN